MLLKYRGRSFCQGGTGFPPALRVMMIGLRGFPEVQGGVEAHAQNLCVRLVQLGCEVEVVMRTRFCRLDGDSCWRGIRRIGVWAPPWMGFEALIHTFLCVFVAVWRQPDVLHIHGVGPAVLTPLARVCGLRVVVTHHGNDYEREKWGVIARAILRLGERCAARFADACIAISAAGQATLLRKHGMHAELIVNGVTEPMFRSASATLERFQLEPGRYVLMVARLVEEKRHLDLLAAFAQAGLSGWKLVLVGGADRRTAYSDRVVSQASATPGVVMTGTQTGEHLAELYSNAGLFVLPSSHEGLPIALIEAVSYGIAAAASDIPGNREIGLPAMAYFPVGDRPGLARLLQRLGRNPPAMAAREQLRRQILQRYSWASAASRTLDLYHAIVVRSRPDLPVAITDWRSTQNGRGRSKSQ